jgi:uncharacterized membrane protein HdeD (DUF308 family)
VLLGGSRPTRRLELVSGDLTTAFGLLILYLVNQQSDPALVFSFSLYFIALGVTRVFIGRRPLPADPHFVVVNVGSR